MESRDFSDSIKLEVIKNNIEKNNGNILCENCGKRMVSLVECHFDHILPFSKGGKSVLSNCQILCSVCNEKKHAKFYDDFLLEEKAKRFLAGEVVFDDSVTSPKADNEIDISNSEKRSLNKEEFDEIVGAFIDKKGNIKTIDFSREYNHLPSLRYVYQFYDNINKLKKAFGITDLSLNWDRERILKTLEDHVAKKGTLLYEELKNSNNLPSLPCILRYYPEYANFSEVKEGLLNLQCRTQWDREKAIAMEKICRN